MTSYNPCKGYDAAVSYLGLMIENYANQTHTTFDELLKQNIFWITDRINQISYEYQRSVDNVTETLIDMHESWD